MRNKVRFGDQMKCSCGSATSYLVVLPKSELTNDSLEANIVDNKPMVNILPFGMCSTLANPTVASATSSALGILTPMPCVPAIPNSWTPGRPLVFIDNQPAIDKTSICLCAYGGVISFTIPE